MQAKPAQLSSLLVRVGSQPVLSAHASQSQSPARESPSPMATARIANGASGLAVTTSFDWSSQVVPSTSLQPQIDGGAILQTGPTTQFHRI